MSESPEREILMKAALALWGIDAALSSENWSLNNAEMRQLHDVLVADGQIDPEDDDFWDDLAEDATGFPETDPKWGDEYDDAAEQAADEARFDRRYD